MPTEEKILVFEVLRLLRMASLVRKILQRVIQLSLSVVSHAKWLAWWIRINVAILSMSCHRNSHKTHLSNVVSARSYKRPQIKIKDALWDSFSTATSMCATTWTSVTTAAILVTSTLTGVLIQSDLTPAILSMSMTMTSAILDTSST